MVTSCVFKTITLNLCLWLSSTAGVKSHILTSSPFFLISSLLSLSSSPSQFLSLLSTNAYSQSLEHARRAHYQQALSLAILFSPILFRDTLSFKLPRLNLNFFCSPGSPRSHDPSASASQVSRITGLHGQDCVLFLSYKDLWSQWVHPDHSVWSHVKFLSHPVCIGKTITGSREEDTGNLMEPLFRAFETWILWGLPPDVEKRWESREGYLSSSPGNWEAGAAVEAALIGATLVAWHFGLVDAVTQICYSRGCSCVSHTSNISP